MTGHIRTVVAHPLPLMEILRQASELEAYGVCFLVHFPRDIQPPCLLTRNDLTKLDTRLPVVAATICARKAQDRAHNAECLKLTLRHWQKPAPHFKDHGRRKFVYSMEYVEPYNGGDTVSVVLRYYEMKRSDGVLYVHNTVELEDAYLPMTSLEQWYPNARIHILTAQALGYTPGEVAVHLDAMRDMPKTVVPVTLTHDLCIE